MAQTSPMSPQWPVRAGGDARTRRSTGSRGSTTTRRTALRQRGRAVPRRRRRRRPPRRRALFRYPRAARHLRAGGRAAVEPARLRQIHRGRASMPTTVTQPADFRAYLLEQLEPLVGRIRRPDRGRRRRPGNPLSLRVRERRRTRRAAAPTPPSSRASFPMPSLAMVGDEIADGAFEIRHGASGRSRCSTRRASIIRCAGSCITPAPTGARCSPGCC